MANPTPTMDTALRQLWHNAIAESARSGVPAPMLVEAYLKLMDEHGADISAEDVRRMGDQLVADYGATPFLDAEQLAVRDAAIQRLAAAVGLTFEQTREAVEMGRRAAAAGQTDEEY